jgi:Spy/CpxP family protein refolding chaperone
MAVLLRFLLVAMLSAALLSAQGKKGGGGGGRGDDSIPMRETPNRFDQISNVLKLNKDQKKQVKSIMDDAQKEAVPLRDEVVKSGTAVGDIVAGGKGQPEIDQAVNTYAAAEAKMTAIEMKAFAKIYALLEKDQQANAGPVFFLMRGAFKGKNWLDVKE